MGYWSHEKQLKLKKYDHLYKQKKIQGYMKQKEL